VPSTLSALVLVFVTGSVAEANSSHTTHLEPPQKGGFLLAMLAQPRPKHSNAVLLGDCGAIHGMDLGPGVLLHHHRLGRGRVWRVHPSHAHSRLIGKEHRKREHQQGGEHTLFVAKGRACRGRFNDHMDEATLRHWDRGDRFTSASARLQVSNGFSLVSEQVKSQSIWITKSAR